MVLKLSAIRNTTLLFVHYAFYITYSILFGGQVYALNQLECQRIPRRTKKRI